MPEDLKITTGMLFQGALLFAVIDGVYVPLLAWRIREAAFHRLKWPLPFAAAAVWFGIWSWAIGNFWDSVYRYLFPTWGQRSIPVIAGVVAAAVGAGLWALASRFPGRQVVVFCFSGALLGVLTHIWAVYRGVVTEPPMLQGASPLGAVTIAFFEFMFYWSTILVLAGLIERAWSRVRALYN